MTASTALTALPAGELPCAPIPAQFTDARSDDYDRLRRICLSCTALQACRVYVLSHDVAGYAAGMGPRQRRRIQRIRGVRFDDIDRVAVERRLHGDRRVRLTRAEFEVALRVGAERFGSRSAAAVALGLSGSRAAQLTTDEAMRPVRQRAAAALGLGGVA